MLCQRAHDQDISPPSSSLSETYWACITFLPFVLFSLFKFVVILFALALDNSPLLCGLLVVIVQIKSQQTTTNWTHWITRNGVSSVTQCARKGKKSSEVNVVPRKNMLIWRAFAIAFKNSKWEEKKTQIVYTFSFCYVLLKTNIRIESLLLWVIDVVVRTQSEERKREKNTIKIHLFWLFEQFKSFVYLCCERWWRAPPK